MNDNELNGNYQHEELPPPQALNGGISGNHMFEPPRAQERKASHPLTAAEQKHVAEVKAQMDAMAAQVLRLKGVIFDQEAELSFMRRHLSVFLTMIATNAGLPPGSAISADGTALIAREG